MTAAPTVSVVIPVRGALDELQAQLHALSHQVDPDETWEIVLADNGATDDIDSVVDRYAGSCPIRAVDARAEPGQAGAINVAVATSAAESILLLDADDVVAADYVANMVGALRAHDFVAARLDITELNPEPLRRSRPSPQTDGLGDPHGFLPSAAGCAIGLRRTAFDRVGGLDPTIREGNDVDLSWRLQLAGIHAAFVPEAVVHYRYRPGLRSAYGQARGYGVAGPVLYRRYGGLGMPRRSWRRALHFHLAVVPRLLRIRCRADLASVLFLLGYRVGLVSGSVRERVRYL